MGRGEETKEDASIMSFIGATFPNESSSQNLLTGRKNQFFERSIKGFQVFRNTAFLTVFVLCVVNLFSSKLKRIDVSNVELRAVTTSFDLPPTQQSVDKPELLARTVSEHPDAHKGKSGEMEPFLLSQQQVQPPQNEFTNGTNTLKPNTTISNSSLPPTSSKSFQIRKSRSSQPRTRVKKFSHFLSHIPKTGATSAMFTVANLLYHSPEYLALPQEDKFRPCDEAKKPPFFFHSSYRYDYKGTKCTMWMSEDVYTDRPEHIYTIVRNPMHHVLSMYFHCTESPDHRRSRTTNKMENVSLDEWLDSWNTVVELQQKHVAMPTNTSKSAIEEETRKLEQRFDCYNPFNMQSKFVNFTFGNQRVPNDDGTINTTEVRLAAKEDLRKRFTVIGDMTHLFKSICLIAIHYAGWVPGPCNCKKGDTINNSTIAVTTTTTTHRRRRQRRRRLDSTNQPKSPSNNTTAAANSSPTNNKAPSTMTQVNADHGVTHHGASFETSQHQIEAIAKLTQLDRVLYGVVQELFQEQVLQVQNEYNIVLCESLG